MNKFVYLCVSLLTLHSEVCSGSLANWETMQHYYHTLVSNISSIPPAISENDLCHSYWQKTRTNIRKIVLGHDPNFLRNEITGTMVRTGMSIVQAYEICFLTECASDEVKNMIQGFQDTNFGHLPKECEVFKCSSSTLGHLFYAAQTIDLMEQHVAEDQN